jgi:sulfur carrier protein ThiS
MVFSQVEDLTSCLGFANKTSVVEGRRSFVDEKILAVFILRSNDQITVF